MVGKNLLIEGPGARTLTIARSGSTKFRILHVTSDGVYVSGVTITNGDASSGVQGGGAILVEVGAILTVDYCAITNNTRATWQGCNSEQRWVGHGQV